MQREGHGETYTVQHALLNNLQLVLLQKETPRKLAPWSVIGNQISLFFCVRMSTDSLSRALFAANLEIEASTGIKIQSLWVHAVFVGAGMECKPNR